MEYLSVVVKLAIGHFAQCFLKNNIIFAKKSRHQLMIWLYISVVALVCQCGGKLRL
jgi:hypothetical protein